MAQGNMKKKVQVPKGSKKQKYQRKAAGVKKGGMTIAPKKARKIEEVQMNKNFSKILASKIEKDVCQKAGGLEAKSFFVVKTATEQGNPSKS